MQGEKHWERAAYVCVTPQKGMHGCLLLRMNTCLFLRCRPPVGRGGMRGIISWDMAKTGSHIWEKWVILQIYFFLCIFVSAVIFRVFRVVLISPACVCVLHLRLYARHRRRELLGDRVRVPAGRNGSRVPSAFRLVGSVAGNQKKNGREVTRKTMRWEHTTEKR